MICSDGVGLLHLKISKILQHASQPWFYLGCMVQPYGEPDSPATDRHPPHVGSAMA